MSSEKEQHYKELLTLKTIAETLNQSNDMKKMLQITLEKLLELTNLQTGWIFLVDDEPDYEHMADHNLPPALMRKDKEPMRCDVCLCLALYWEEGLNEAVNIIECERLHNAQTYSWGDTHNLTHHATIPLTIRGERLGLLNVGSPGKESFSEEELTFLESIAFQIGTAVERTRLFEQKEKQAVDEISRFIVDYYANANEVTRYIWKINDMEKLLTSAVEQVGRYFEWPTVAMILEHGDELRLNSIYHEGKAQIKNENLVFANEKKSADIISKAFYEQKIALNEEEQRNIANLSKHPFSVAIPLKVHEIHLKAEPMGVLFIGRDTEAFSGLEMEMLGVLADHISLAMEKIHLYEEWQELLLTEERNRLSRDLHDSVNQKLFSLSLMARGLQEFVQSEEIVATEAVRDIGQLAHEALTEMRSLIWQLRPHGEVKGILGSLQEYAEKIGIRLTIQMKKTLPLTKDIEEPLWRIGQEALNNVRKHSKTNQAWIRIEREKGVLKMKISDQGCGFVPEQLGHSKKTLGITSMRERAAEINGNLNVSSEEGIGTLVTVTVPFAPSKEVANED